MTLRRHNIFLQESGVHLIELAIALPIFFMFIFGLIDLSRIVAGYSAVRSAVALGGRRGAGLDRLEWRSISSLFPDSATQTLQIRDPNLLSSSPAFVSDGTDPTLAPWYFQQLRQVSLDSLYRIELRAISYGNLSLSKNLGSIRYPCENQAGCARCFTLRGTPDYTRFFSTGGLGATWTVKIIALKCTYDVPITLPSVALGLFPNYVTVSSQGFIPIDSYDDMQYEP